MRRGPVSRPTSAPTPDGSHHQGGGCRQRTASAGRDQGRLPLRGDLFHRPPRRAHQFPSRGSTSSGVGKGLAGSIPAARAARAALTPAAIECHTWSGPRVSRKPTWRARHARVAEHPHEVEVGALGTQPGEQAVEPLGGRRVHLVGGLEIEHDGVERLAGPGGHLDVARRRRSRWPRRAGRRAATR